MFQRAKNGASTNKRSEYIFRSGALSGNQVDALGRATSSRAKSQSNDNNLSKLLSKRAII